MLRTTWKAMGATAAALVPALAAVVATEPPIAAQPAIVADGVVESTTGGFAFPDGTIQTTAAGVTDPLHIIGAPGEPAFGTGGEGDCLWQNSPLLPDANPASFFKDSDGIVRLAGLPFGVDGPGGDGACDIDSDFSDAIIFELPAGYQPDHVNLFPTTAGSMANLVAPEGGVTIEGSFIPGGSVLVLFISPGGTGTTLDGITFPAAPAETASSSSREPANISLQALRDLLH